MKFSKKIFLLVVLLICAFIFPVRADQSLGNIDKNENYDIYYGSSGNAESFVVKRVRIVRVDTINDLEFLVFINDSGFNAKTKEGFILFSSIKAIVPNSTFTIRNQEQY